MATFESVSAASNSGAGNTQPATAVMSASAQVGSYALMIVGNNSAPNQPTGTGVTSGGSGAWEFLGYSQQANASTLSVFGKRVTTGDPGGTVSVPMLGASHWDACCVTYSGCDGVDILFGLQSSGSNSTTVPFPACRPRFPDATVVAFAVCANTVGASAIATPSTSYTSRYDDVTTITGWREVFVQDRTLSGGAMTLETPSSVTNSQSVAGCQITLALLDTGTRFGSVVKPPTPRFNPKRRPTVFSTGNPVTVMQGTASLVGAATVTALATQGAPATVGAAGVVTPNATQLAGAGLAGAGIVTPLVTQQAPATVVGAGVVTPPNVTQGAPATLVGAGAISTVVTQIVAGTTLAGAGVVTALATTVSKATLVGAGAVTALATQGAGATVAGAGAVAANATQLAAAGLAGAGIVTPLATQLATATLVGAGAINATGTSGAQQGVASLTAAGVVTGTAVQGAGATLAATSSLTATGIVITATGTNLLEMLWG